jgi:hypothetical protein
MFKPDMECGASHPGQAGAWGEPGNSCVRPRLLLVVVRLVETAPLVGSAKALVVD